jgi:hypothetical protein
METSTIDDMESRRLTESDVLIFFPVPSAGQLLENSHEWQVEDGQQDRLKLT